MKTIRRYGCCPEGKVHRYGECPNAVAESLEQIIEDDAKLTMPLFNRSGVYCLIWSEDDKIRAYHRNGVEAGTWDADARLDGVVTRRTAIRTMNRIARELDA